MGSQYVCKYVYRYDMIRYEVITCTVTCCTHMLIFMRVHKCLCGWVRGWLAQIKEKLRFCKCCCVLSYFYTFVLFQNALLSFIKII